MEKKDLLVSFREKAQSIIEETSNSTKGYKEKASVLNKGITAFREEYIESFTKSAKDNSDLLEKILLVTYVSYIVMLEYRNEVWNYDYMAFSRRIGEFWEPFCKLPFFYPVLSLEIYSPPKIEEVKETLKNQINDLVESLSIEQEIKEKLMSSYQALWTLLNSSGHISLSLDLHYKQNGEYYDVDYKSGFSSNEKGNTNRLLLVASIYKSLSEKHNNLIFVRQKEEQNNHYLQTLKNSGVWNVYCADDAYNMIKKFTGFDIKAWMNINMNWENDISPQFRDYLQRNKLLKYLTW